MTARSGPAIARLAELRDRVTEASGERVRHPATEAQPYVEKVRRHAYKVVDRDMADLRAAGWSEDEIFELTVATALDAGLSRWSRAARVLEEARR